MKKFYISFVITIPLILIIGFLWWFFGFSTSGFDNTYYVSDIKTYVRVHAPAFSPYSYIGFSNQKEELNEDDLVRIEKWGATSYQFIIDPGKPNKIFVVDEYNNIEIPNKKKSIITIITKDNPTFFDDLILAGIEYPMIKPEYVEVFIETPFTKAEYQGDGINDYPIPLDHI